MGFDPKVFEKQEGRPVERYPLDGCPLKRRDGSESFPFAGKSVWLTYETPGGLHAAGMALRASGKSEEAGDRGYQQAARSLSLCVAGHDLHYPQPWQNPEAWDETPSEVMFYIYQVAVTGEAPDARPNGSTAGQDGSSTQPSMVTTTSD